MKRTCPVIVATKSNGATMSKMFKSLVIYINKEPFVITNAAKEAVMLLLASCYVFNLEYPETGNSFFQFLEEHLMGKVSPQKNITCSTWRQSTRSSLPKIAVMLTLQIHLCLRGVGQF